MEPEKTPSSNPATSEVPTATPVAAAAQAEQGAATGQESEAPEGQPRSRQSVSTQSPEPQQAEAAQAAPAEAAADPKVQQARASITALTSLFDDPVKLKPREKAEADDDGLASAMLTTPRRSKQSAQEARAKIARALEDADAAQKTEPQDEKSEETVAAEAVSQASDAETKAASSASDVSSASETESETDAEKSEASKPEEAEKKSSLSPDQQVRIKRYEDHISLIFPQEQKVANPDVTLDFVDSELWQQLQQRLSGGERFWKNNTPVHLNAQNHLLDSRQLQELGEALDRYDLKLTRVATSRRQTAVAAATAGFSIDQGAELPALVSLTGEAEAKKDEAIATEPLYLQTTVRSGAEIRHPGSVIIMGDLNPGSSVVADGDILIWGRLRGVAHAGASGNKSSIILALKMEPTQLRIADALARVADTGQGPVVPEVAYVTAKNDIRITEAAGFTRPYR